MRVPIVILALVATPLLADVSAAQGKKLSHKSKDACSKPGLRTGQKSIDWILKHFDKACVPAPTPAPAPEPAPAPTPEPVVNVDSATPAPTPEPAPVPAPNATGTAITGTVYIDLNWSNVPNPDEPRLAGWTVQLVLDGAVAKSVSTDANGVFRFSDVVVGNYAVCVTPKTNFVQISPRGTACPSGMGYSASVTMYDLNVVFEGLDFGYYDSTAP